MPDVISIGAMLEDGSTDRIHRAAEVWNPLEEGGDLSFSQAGEPRFLIAFEGGVPLDSCVGNCDWTIAAAASAAGAAARALGAGTVRDRDELVTLWQSISDDITGDDGQTYSIIETFAFDETGEVGETGSSSTTDGGKAELANVTDFLANDDQFTVSTGETITLDVLTNDTTGTDGAQFSSINLPSIGGLEFDPTSAMLIYTAPNHSGTTEVGYTITDGTQSSSASAFITITDQNRPPSAVDDRVATVSGRSVTVDVLANDSDPDGDTVRLAGLMVPARGTVSLDAAGSRGLHAGFGFHRHGPTDLHDRRHPRRQRYWHRPFRRRNGDDRVIPFERLWPSSSTCGCVECGVGRFSCGFSALGIACW